MRLSLSRILREPSLNGIYRLSGARELEPSLDGRLLSDKKTLLTALGLALEFPEYYAPNWDALEECLQDMSWRSGPITLRIRHADRLLPPLRHTLMDIFAEAARTWASQGRCCSLFLSGLRDADQLPLVT
ncbi:MAG TPA: barstar family protein [Thiobacillaceae bacterium]|nr:barstar family protein [Thiobacillaceae bacterium]HNU65312.1 barstar family protein [Thiobacillaceae bacterium]